MKRIAAKYVSIILAAVATFFVTTASPGFSHRPETPEELLK